jgi:acetyl esterase/lipase
MLRIIQSIINLSYFFLNLLHWNTQVPEVNRIIRNVSYGKNKRNKLDIYIPDSKGPFPVIIYFHGGGFIASDKRNYNRLCCAYAQKGYAVFNVNYRLVPEYQYPVQLQDVTDALRWIIENHQDYDCSLSNVFLVGDSSGAYLASWYASAISNHRVVSENGVENFLSLPRISGLVLFYGAFDIEGVLKGNFPLKDKIIPAYLGPALTSPERVKAASPLQNIVEGFPPTFLCVSENDPLFEESRNLLARLQELDIETWELFFSHSDYPDADHGFLNFYKKEYAKEAFRESIEFLESKAREVG